VKFPGSLNDALGYDVTPHDAAKDIHQDSVDLFTLKAQADIFETGLVLR
jgi:hypothetical protein